MMFGLPPVRLVADFRASAMGIKPKSPGSVATVSQLLGINSAELGMVSPELRMTLSSDAASTRSGFRRVACVFLGV